MISKILETLRSVCRCRWICWIQCCISPRTDDFNDLQNSQRFVDRMMSKKSSETVPSDGSDHNEEYEKLVQNLLSDAPPTNS